MKKEDILRKDVQALAEVASKTIILTLNGRNILEYINVRQIRESCKRLAEAEVYPFNLDVDDMNLLRQIQEFSNGGN